MAVVGLKPRSRIGSLIGHGFNRDNVIQEAIEQLRRATAVVEFTNTDGWKIIRAKYEETIHRLEQHQLSLGHAKTDKNVVEIQQTYHFINALKVLLSITDGFIEEYKNADKTLTHSRETAQRTAR